MSAAAAESRPIPFSAPAAVWKPKRNPWIIAITVTLATFMEVLDTSIANVALPHIAGGLGASVGLSSINLQNRVDSLGRYLVEHGGRVSSLSQGKAMAQGRLYQELLQQSTMLAYLDVIKMLAIAMVLAIPLVFLMKRPKKGAGPMGQ